MTINDSRPLDQAVDCDYVRALKGLAHPIRLAALIALSREELSPSQFARSRGEPVSNVSYHFRLLAGLGLIELARTRPVRGSVEHIYRRIEPKEAEEIKLTLARGPHFALAPADLVALVASTVMGLSEDDEPAVDDLEAVPAGEPGQLQLLPYA